MLSLLWFKRDLRVQDHPALALAAAQGRVLPVYIVEPGLWGQGDASARQWGFVRECLETLRADLARLGQPLLIRTGDAVQVLARLHAKHRFTQIVTHEDIGNAWSRARDRQVAGWVQDKGLRWVRVPQDGAARQPGDPAALPTVAEGTGTPPDGRALGLPADPCPSCQRGGRARAEQVLDGFLTPRGLPYRGTSPSPLEAERASSRLSPYISFGVLSAHEVAQASQRARAENRGQAAWSAGLRRFETQLTRRDGVTRMLEREPMLETRALHPATDSLRPRVPDRARLQAWSRGETGLPFVDACMRYLVATGWLPFQARALLVSVASYHLWLDWRATGPHLARLFTDYDPCLHWAHMQMQAGTVGTGAPRIYDPVRMGLEHDPQGRFIRRWLPELAPVPDAFVHRPWLWPDARRVLGGRYPEPVVDPATAARAARAAIADMRRAAGPCDQPAKARGDRKPRLPRRAGSAQMWLDL